MNGNFIRYTNQDGYTITLSYNDLCIYGKYIINLIVGDKNKKWFLNDEVAANAVYDFLMYLKPAQLKHLVIDE